MDAVNHLAKQGKADLTLPPLLIHVKRNHKHGHDLLAVSILFFLSCQVNGSGSFVVFASV